MTKNQDKKTIVIVSGATGDLGKAYIAHYATQPNTICYGISRREDAIPVAGVNYLRADLSEITQTESALAKVDLEGIIAVRIIHPVGKFKFEARGIPALDANNDGIDDEVLASNLGTFYNIVQPILEKRALGCNFPLTVVGFGSLSDSYKVPWWNSYSVSKQILRKEMRSLSEKVSEVNSIFINLSSVKTSNECKTRPYADMSYWISPAEIVARTVGAINSSTSKIPYQEMNVFEPSPTYHDGYYGNYAALFAKWQSEMGTIDENNCGKNE